MKMKKSIKILLVLLCLTVIVGAFKAVVSAEDSAIESNEAMVTEAITEAVVEETIDISVVNEIIKDSDTISDAIISVASKFGITIEDAEELVEDVVHLGDKYLGETEIWEVIKEDIAANPEKYVLIALCFLMFIALVVFIIRWIVHNMSQLRTLKMNVTSLKKSVDGDDSDEGKASSLRALITAKNDEIKALEEKDAALEKEVIKLREEAAAVTRAAEEVKKNTTNALNITQESALQIAQLLCIAMDKGKMPVVSKEARELWYSNAQTKIKAAAGIEGGESDGSKADETSQKV